MSLAERLAQKYRMMDTDRWSGERTPQPDFILAVDEALEEAAQKLEMDFEDKAARIVRGMKSGS